MRLLRANSILSPHLEFVEFNPDEIEPYAILSHTWTKDEVLFTDVINGTAADRSAYAKVRHTCRQALEDSLNYVWIDTCCIDKSSSAELSEAINSMFTWYRQALVCYAYLSDLFTEGVDTLAQSRWFTRGWTLQELIAPEHVVFYAGKDWSHIGVKSSLSAELADITRISEDILTGERQMETASVANRMGWAARRVTTRPEDMAYCLMGIFSVNMPLLYGEGAKAFTRLQEEIMKQSTDHSLFVWLDKDAPDEKEYGFLAPSPKCFDMTHAIVPYQQWETILPHAMTNEGLSIHLPIRHSRPGGVEAEYDSAGREIWQAILDCPSTDFRNAYFTTVYVVKTQLTGQHYARVKASRRGVMKMGSIMHGEASGRQQIYVRPTPAALLSDADRVYPWHYISLNAGPHSSLYKVIQIVKLPLNHQFETVQGERWGSKSWSQLDKIIMERGAGKLSVAVLFERKSDRQRLVVSIGSYDARRLAFWAEEVHVDDEDNRTSLLTPKMPTPSALQKSFVPMPMEQTVSLPNHQVKVMSQSKVEDMAKYYLLHIEINPSFPNAPSSSFTKTQISSSDAELHDGLKRDGLDRFRRLLGRNKSSPPMHSLQK